jgi:hypothetical protein
MGQSWITTQLPGLTGEEKPKQYAAIETAACCLDPGGPGLDVHPSSISFSGSPLCAPSLSFSLSRGLSWRRRLG